MSHEPRCRTETTASQIWKAIRPAPGDLDSGSNETNQFIGAVGDCSCLRDSGVSLGACLPDGPVPIVEFVMNEITHIRADEGMPPKEVNPIAPRCVGDPPPRGIPAVLPEGYNDITSMQEQITDLRAQLRLLENRRQSEPFLTREQARHRDIAHQELQARTLAAPGSLEGGETSWDDSTQALMARHKFDFAHSHRRFINRIYPGVEISSSVSQHLGRTIVMNHVRRLRDAGDHGECV